MTEFDDKPKPTNAPPYLPPETLPDTLKVPDNTIVLVSDATPYCDPVVFTKPPKQRQWFTPYFYHCLPLVMGNQLGFILHATHDFVCRWDGGGGIEATVVHELSKPAEEGLMLVTSHFGSGIVTIQSRWAMRTPKGVNLLIKEPPNYPTDGVSFMNAVVETDNLRRDFTFNLKLTRPNCDVFFERGQPVGCVVPYPRFFFDPYELEQLTDPDDLAVARQTVENFAFEREHHDTAGPRHRYMEGIDIYNIPFDEHQKSFDGGKYWQMMKQSGKLPSRREAESTPPTARPWWKKFLNWGGEE